MSGQDKTSSRKQFPLVRFALLLVTAIVSFWLMRGKAYDGGELLMKAPFLEHVYVPEYKKIVALTFDDGPSVVTTPRLLEILREKNAVATFFELGKLARNNPDITRQIIAQGSEVGSHTMYHQNFNKISGAAVSNDINEARSVLNNIIGDEISLTRTPYGITNNNVKKIAETPIILWTIDTLDWQSRDPEAIKAIVRDKTFDGAIILMHDIYNTTVDAVPDIIDYLRADGYDFVTVSQMAEIRGVELEAGKAYGSFRP